MTALAGRSRTRDTNTWPGFVDALATLLMVIIFVLMIFIVAQFYLTQLLSGRDEALDRLEREVQDLISQLTLERDIASELRINLSEATASLQSSIAERDRLGVRLEELADRNSSLELQLAEAQADRETLSRRLATFESLQDNLDENIARVISERDALLARLHAAEMEARLNRAERDELDAGMQEALQVIEANRETISLQLRDLEALRRDIVALKTVRDRLERTVLELTALRTSLESDLEQTRSSASLTEDDLKLARNMLDSLVAKLAASRAENLELAADGEESEARAAELVVLLTDERERASALEARLAEAENRTSLAQAELEKRDIRLAELLSSHDLAREQLTEEQRLSAEARLRVERLRREIRELNRRLQEIQLALEDSERKAEEQKATIVNLNSRLNAALLNRVQELARFRSEFFGEVRKILQGREDVRIVGDRFVFQSEVLFASGSDEIGRAGRSALQRVAEAFEEIRPRIPKDIDWLLQVEGHTDAVPIRSPDFPSNWHLSAARAISVVQFLNERGLPAKRLSAAGFGEFRPEEPDVRESARNRRIEIKLTQR